MSTGPEHVGASIASVLRAIEVTYCARHNLPVVVEPGEDEETEPAPRRRRSRDPPNEELRVKGETFGIDEKKGEKYKWLMN